MRVSGSMKRRGEEDGRDRPNHGKEPLRAQIVSAMASTIC